MGEGGSESRVLNEPGVWKWNALLSDLMVKQVELQEKLAKCLESKYEVEKCVGLLVIFTGVHNTHTLMPVIGH